MLDKKLALRIEKQPRKSGGPRIVYIFKCLSKGCHKEVKVRSSGIKIQSGKCMGCSRKKRPYESIYNRILNDHRKIKVELTYIEFLKFTKIKECYYCNNHIMWKEYATENNDFISAAYYLDRKYNNLSYSKENCVVCCSRCNRLKSNYDIGEFLVICSRIAEIQRKRVNKQFDDYMLKNEGVVYEEKEDLCKDGICGI